MFLIPLLLSSFTIKDRFKEGVFKGDEGFKESLLVGLHCSDYELFKYHVEHRHGANVMRLIYSEIDMLLVSGN